MNEFIEVNAEQNRTIGIEYEQIMTDCTFYYGTSILSHLDVNDKWYTLLGIAGGKCKLMTKYWQ